jgi:hypothetical protein
MIEAGVDEEPAHWSLMTEKQPSQWMVVALYEFGCSVCGGAQMIHGTDSNAPSREFIQSSYKQKCGKHATRAG